MHEHIHTFPPGQSVIMNLAWNGLITNKNRFLGKIWKRKLKCWSVQILITIMQCLWCAGHTEGTEEENEVLALE